MKSFLLYGSQTPQDVEDAKDDVMQDNLKLVRLYSCIAIIAFFILTVVTFVLNDLSGNRSVYFACFIISAVFLILSSIHSAREKDYAPALAFCFIIFMLGFGLALSVMSAASAPTVSFVILLFAMPLLFTLLPWQSVTISSISIIVYIITALLTQPEKMLVSNLINVITYGIISMPVGAFVMKIKVERVVAVHRNRILSEYDQLTNLHNRRSYEEHLQALADAGRKDGARICVIDINGLKGVNDTLGHNAGDVLIIGAGSCVQKTIGDYGECYRTGGDEFIAIINEPAPENETLIALLKDSATKWSTPDYPDMKLTFSVGIAAGAEEGDIPAAVHLADQRMYSDKARYYRESGAERRQR